MRSISISFGAGSNSSGDANHSICSAILWGGLKLARHDIELWIYVTGLNSVRFSHVTETQVIQLALPRSNLKRIISGGGVPGIADRERVSSAFAQCLNAGFTASQTRVEEFHAIVIG